MENKKKYNLLLWVVRILVVGMFTLMFTLPLYCLFALFLQIITDNFDLFSKESVKLYTLCYLVGYVVLFSLISLDDLEKIEKPNK